MDKQTQEKNRLELAKKMEKAERGEGKWTSLEDEQLKDILMSEEDTIPLEEAKVRLSKKFKK